MLPVFWAVFRSYAPVILLPVSAVIGVSHNLESILSDKYAPYKPSIEEQREDRQLAEATSANGNLWFVLLLFQRKAMQNKLYK